MSRIEENEQGGHRLAALSDADDAEVRRWVTAQRAAQGLPERVEDTRVLGDVRTLLRPVAVEVKQARKSKAA